MSSQTENSAKEEALKASNKFLHPKSRKCIAMIKKVKKDTKKERAKQETKLKQSLLADKLLWFQKNMVQDVCPYTIELTAELVEKYIARNDEELEQIKIKRSIGGNRNKQHASREDAIRMTKERERGDYESCGLEIPNILNTYQCITLKKWDGNLKFLPNFKFHRFRKRHLVEELKKKQRITHQENVLIADTNETKQETVSINESKVNVLDNNVENVNNTHDVDNKSNEVTLSNENAETMDTE